MDCPCIHVGGSPGGDEDGVADPPLEEVGAEGPFYFFANESPESVAGLLRGRVAAILRCC